MKVHEYQGKELFRKYQIPPPGGVPVFSVEEALKALATFMPAFKVGSE